MQIGCENRGDSKASGYRALGVEHLERHADNQVSDCGNQLVTNDDGGY